MQRSKRVVLGKGGGTGIRRILRVGEVPGICLPKEYLTSKGLKPGDEVAVVWNGELRVYPLKESGGKIEK